MKSSHRSILLTLALCALPHLVRSQALDIPAWAQPGSATHAQVPPPADYHRPTRTVDGQVGIFDGQSDIGGPVIAGNASYDSGPRQYTINSAGYNIWYTRDEFHYIWKKVSGDVSLSADISFPNPDGYDDRKVVLVIRQDLDDDSKEAMGALHGAGLIHLAQRPSKGANIKETFRMQAKDQPDAARTGAPAAAKRLGIEKRGDSIALFVSLDGGPMHQAGEPTTLHFDGACYVGIGFCSHTPDKSDTATVSNVVLEQPAAGQR